MGYFGQEKGMRWEVGVGVIVVLWCDGYDGWFLFSEVVLSGFLDVFGGDLFDFFCGLAVVYW